VPNRHLIHFYISVVRPVLEPLWHCALTNAQSENLEAVQKRAIHIIYNPNRGMPYSSMLFYANLNSLASHREDLFRIISVILCILPLVSTVTFLHPDPRQLPVPSAVVPLYSMDSLSLNLVVLLLSIFTCRF